MMNTEMTRQQMVDQQVRTWDVFDPDVLQTIGKVARDRYVPADLVDCAYADVELPLPHGQCMLRPSIVGRILQAVDCHDGDKVLDIGTGSGYLARCLSANAASVTSIDIFDDFVESARARLADDGVENVQLLCMDATVELPEGQFDAITITGSAESVDPRFLEALAPGGRLFIVVGRSPVMTATLITREEDGGTSSRELFETDIPALVAAAGPAEFSF